MPAQSHSPCNTSDQNYVAGVLDGGSGPLPALPGHQESNPPCLFAYFDNALIFIHATSHFPGPVCLQTTVLGAHACAGEGQAGGEPASMPAALGDAGGEDMKVTEAITSAQMTRALLLLSLLLRGRRGCEVWRRTDTLCPQLLQTPRVMSAWLCFHFYGGWTRHFAALHIHRHAPSVRQAEGFLSTEKAKACGLFSKGEDLIYKHLHAYFGF